MEREYNENITIIDDSGDLGENEYFALMVTHMPDLRIEDREFFDLGKHWLGLEHSDNQVYISKKKGNRQSPTRGKTLRIRVKDKMKCCELTF